MSNTRESYAHLADKRPIYYIEEGAGPPFLYLHAGSNNADSARGLFAKLRDRFHCISLDRVGYRHSGTLDRVTVLEEQVEAIAVVHRACSSDPAWVFGRSAGGVWALAYALAHPDRVRGLLLMEPALHSVIPSGSRSPSDVAMIESVGPLFRAGRLREATKGFWKALEPEISDEALAKLVAGCLSPEGRLGWESLATEAPLVVSWCPTPSEWDQLIQPALVLEGDRTSEVLRPIAAKVSELLPSGELTTLEGLGHDAPKAAPDVVAQRVIEFIDRVVAAVPKSDSAM